MRGASADLETQIRAACAGLDWGQAAALAFDGYGDELLGFLVAVLRNQAQADDAFSLFCENMVKGLPAFAWRSSFRTWAYTIARNAASRVRRDEQRRRAVPLDDPRLEAIAARLRSRTPSFLATEMRERVAKLRATLEPDDQTLLILRLGRGLGWREIAQVLATDEALAPAALDTLAATLRKRFERLKRDLKARALAEP